MASSRFAWVRKARVSARKVRPSAVRRMLVNDYSADATMRSIEDSLKRLKTDRLDIVYVHDVAQDFYGDEWLVHYEAARVGAFRVLTRLREEGVIKAWGLGVNKVEPLEITLDLTEAQPNAFLLAGRYTLLDHDRALQRLMPAALANEVSIVVGGPYSSGVLAGGTHFEYQKAPPEIVARVARIKAIADKHGVSLKAAAVQFALPKRRRCRGVFDHGTRIRASSATARRRQAATLLPG